MYKKIVWNKEYKAENESHQTNGMESKKEGLR